jgi:flagellar biosynthesis/type III secretory pathway protein FliH
MDGFAFMPKPGTLFADDFDLPEALAEVAPEPEVIEPVFSAVEVTDARETARQEGHAAGLREAAASDMAATRQAVEAISAQIKAECEAAATKAAQSAEAIAGLLLDSLAATFPALCARYGDAEVRAIVRAVLPALTQEPTITIRANRRTAVAVKQEIARLDPDLAAHVQASECDSMPPGDVRIAWRNGAAVRDASALWQQVADVLAPAGLLRADAAIRETIDGG